MTEFIFYSTLAIVIYTYVGYPLLVLLRGSLCHKAYKKEPITPSVSLIIACHNEEAGIEAKLRNILSLKYPRDRLQVIIAADGCTDRTEEIVKRNTSHGVTLLSLPRGGKAPALNSAVRKATGDIIVFSDANSMYAQDAIRKIVQPFADVCVGGVAGNQVYRKSLESNVVDAGEQGYWNFDRLLKIAQSRAGNAISATGAIYAIRKRLFRDVPGGVTDDFAISTRVIEQGYRLVFEAEAICYEPVAGAARAEFQRKTRIMTRGLRSVLLRRKLLNPFRYGFYSLQLFSHKVLRRLVVFPLLLMAVVTPLLWNDDWPFRVATVIEGLFFLAAAIGLVCSRRRLPTPKVIAVPFFFCMVNAAVLVAVWKVLFGQRIELWQPNRETKNSPRGEQAATEIHQSLA
jgi:cellulose synthase/poly-beta-1,6-N-acetylglucosamine synthase-like glycosyltransferase